MPEKFIFQEEIRNPKLGKIQSMIAQHQQVPDQWLGMYLIIFECFRCENKNYEKKLDQSYYLFFINNFGS